MPVSGILRLRKKFLSTTDLICASNVIFHIPDLKNLIESVDLLLNKNGTFYFSVRDLFNTRKYRGITELENYYSEYEYQRRRRQATLSFTYRLNQKKKRVGNRSGAYNRDDKDRY